MLVRAAAVFLLLATVAAGDDLRTARKLLASRDVADRLRGIDLCVKLDSAGAIQALEDAIKRSTRQMDRLSVAIDRLDHQWLDAYFKVLRLTLVGVERSAELRAAKRRELVLRRELDALSRDVQLHLRVVKGAGEAFSRLRSEAAIAKLEAGAATEPNPTARMMYLTGLGDATRRRSVPVLLELLDHKDGRVRAAATRALTPFGDAPGVMERLTRLVEEELSWAVRLGAYQAMTGAPFAQAVEQLTRAAIRETGEMAVAVDSYLEGLTGQSFAQKPKRWNLWWQTHAPAIRAGTWQPAPEEESGEAKTIARFFRIPIQSERLVFALDFSGSMEDDFRVKDAEIFKMLRQYRLDETRLGYAQAEFIRAINAMPDGALFNVIGYSTEVTRFAPRLVKLTSSTRKRAVRWVLRLKTDDLTNIYEALRASFKDYLSASGGAGRFKDLPDTIIFLTDGIATRGRFQDSDSLRHLAQIWNRPLDVVIHTVGIGRDHDRSLLKGLAKDSGGYYVDVDRGLKDLQPRRRAMPRGVRDVRAERAVAKQRVAEQVRRLESAYADNRRRAAAELGAMGAQAAAAIPALITLLADEEEEVRLAASAALAKVGVKAVPALAQALGSDDGDVVMGAAAALARIGPEAKEAVPALEKAVDHSDPRAAEAAKAALEKVGS